MKIKRGGLEIGDIKDEALQDLLESGFLLSTDMFLEGADKDWKPLSELSINNNLVKYKKAAGEVSKYAKMVKDFSIFAYHDLKERTKDYGEKLKPQLDAAKSGAADRVDQLKNSAGAMGKSAQDKYLETKTKLVEDYLPQVIEIINKQVLPKMKTTAKAALENEAAFKEIIRKTYKFLPPVITGVISYHAFESVLLSQRPNILAKLQD